MNTSKPRLRICLTMAILWFFSLSPLLKAQDGQDDFALLTQVGIQKKWKYGLNTDLSVRTFWNENATEFRSGFVNAGIDYSLTSRWSFAFNFRFYEVKNLGNSYEERIRLFIDATYELPLADKWDLSWNGRLQRQSYTGKDEDGTNPAKYTLRNKFSLSYKYNWYWNFYVSGEPFIPLGDNSPVLISNYRSEAGLKYRPNLHHKINLFFQVRHPRPLPFGTRFFIAGIQYTYNL